MELKKKKTKDYASYLTETVSGPLEISIIIIIILLGYRISIFLCVPIKIL